MTTYIDFHVLQLLPPSNINRDDTGSPKSARFGGVERHRVSSQSWKRAVRKDFENHLDIDLLGTRTKRGMGLVAERIRELRPEVTEEQALSHAVAVLTQAGIKADSKNPDQTAYLLFLSRQEIARLAETALRIVDGEKVSKKEARNCLLGPVAIDIALFGRMLADAPELNIDASCQVEHALSIHKATQEFDYYTAVDDEQVEESAGAGMIGTVEFISSTLYRYATVNLDKLIENLGDKAAALNVVQAFARSFVTSMPTGKQNTFANRTRPDFVLVEIRDDQPVTLVNAFETPVDNSGQALSAGAEKLARYAIDGDSIFGTAPTASFYTVTDRAHSPKLEEALRERSQNLPFTEIVTQLGNDLASVDN